MNYNGNITRFATEEEINIIIKKMIDDSQEDESLNNDDIIDTFIMWKKSLNFIIRSEIKIDDKEYIYFFCNFIEKEDDFKGEINNLIYSLEDGKLKDCTGYDLIV
jgi:hypothetical protein